GVLYTLWYYLAVDVLLPGLLLLSPMLAFMFRRSLVLESSLSSLLLCCWCCSVLRTAALSLSLLSAVLVALLSLSVFPCCRWSLLSSFTLSLLLAIIVLAFLLCRWLLLSWLLVLLVLEVLAPVVSSCWISDM